MISTLAKDPIARIVSLLWLGLAALYFIPAVPHDLLERLGDRYSTLPLWPWAAAACLYGLGDDTPASERKFWRLQALSFAALLAIEVPWALARASNTPAWDIAAEWCYFAYYACQLASAARTRIGAIAWVLAATAAAAALSTMAMLMAPLYASADPSYLTYLLFDIAATISFWRLSRRSTGAWATVFTGLAYTSSVVFATDLLDWLSYKEVLHLVAGMKTDILWTLPPLCYALVARLARANHLRGADAAPTKAGV